MSMKAQNAVPRIDILDLALTGPPIERIQALVDFVRSQPVVELRQARRLAQMLEDLKSDDLLVSLGLEMKSMSQWFFLYFGQFVLDTIAGHRPPGARPRDESIERIARKIAANPYFRKHNQRVRRYYAEMDAVPYGEVRGHIRNGFPVSSHIRFYGNRHLLELPYGAYPEFVGRIIQVLAHNRQYRSWPEHPNARLDSGWHRRYG